MSKAIEQFETFWRQMKDLNPRERYVHPADEDIMTPAAAEKSLLQLHILPLPVNGNLRESDIVLVMLNSGYGDDDAAWDRVYPGEYEELQASKRRNIHQLYTVEDEYPFYDLNPLFCNHPGADYWKGGANLVVPRKRRGPAKLADLATHLSRHWNASLPAVYRELSNRLAVIERLAYPSKNSDKIDSRLLNTLPSCAQSFRLVTGLIAEGEKLVIIMRQAKAFGFTGPEDSTENLVVYKPVGEAIGAQMTMKSRGGPPMYMRMVRRRLTT